MKDLAETALLAALEEGRGVAELAVLFECCGRRDRELLERALRRLRAGGLITYSRGTGKWTRVAAPTGAAR